MKYKTINTYIL